VGRFFQYRLHPFDLKELANQGSSDEILKTLLAIGSFPDHLQKARNPFIKNGIVPIWM